VSWHIRFSFALCSARRILSVPKGDWKMENSDYVRQVAGNIRSQIEKDELATKEKLHDAEVIRQQAPDTFSELKTCVSGTIQNIRGAVRQGNVPLVYQERGLYEFEVTFTRSNHRRAANVRINDGGGIIVTCTDDKPISFMPIVNGNTLEYLQGAQQVSIGDMSQVIINAATKE
jgi:hypothetical protein